MAEVQESVSKLINRIHDRNAKNQTKIKELQVQAKSVQEKINVLTQNLVELQDNEVALSKTFCELTELKSKLINLQTMIKAHSTVSSNNIRAELADIFKIARECQEQRHKELAANIAEQERLNKEIYSIHEKLKAISVENQVLNGGPDRDERSIATLFPYVEKRPISYGMEYQYLKAFATGADLESYFPHKDLPYCGPTQTFSEVQTHPDQGPRSIEGSYVNFTGVKQVGLVRRP